MINEKGNTLLNVLIIFTLLVTGAAILYPLIIQNTSDQQRAYHQLQTINVANTTMETILQRDSALPSTTINLNNNKIDIDTSVTTSPTQKVFSVTVYYGDENSNKTKDMNERYFYKKEITTNKAVAVIEKTKTPTLRIEAGILYIKVENCPTDLTFYNYSYNSTTNLYTQGSQINSVSVGSCNTTTKEYSTSVTPFIGKTIGIIAKEGTKDTSEPAIITIPSGSSGSSGLVQKIIDGVITYHGIEQVMTSPGELIVLTGTNFDGQSLINFTAAEDIVIQQGAILSTSNNGSATITMTSTSGDIVVKGKLFNASNNNSYPYDIKLDASNGNLDLDDSLLEAERQIELIGNTITAKRAKIIADKNQSSTIRFYINTTGKLYVQDLELKFSKSDNAEAFNKNNRTAYISNTNICGRLSPNGNGTLNSLSNFVCN